MSKTWRRGLGWSKDARDGKSRGEIVKYRPYLRRKQEREEKARSKEQEREEQENE